MHIKLLEDVENVGRASRVVEISAEAAKKLIADGKAEFYVSPRYRKIPGANDRIQFQHRLFILHDTADHLAGDCVSVFDDKCNFLIENRLATPDRCAGPETRKDAMARRGKGTKPTRKFTEGPPRPLGTDVSEYVAAADRAATVRKNDHEEAAIALNIRHNQQEETTVRASQKAYQELANELKDFRDQFAAELKAAIFATVKQIRDEAATPPSPAVEEPPPQATEAL